MIKNAHITAIELCSGDVIVITEREKSLFLYFVEMKSNRGFLLKHYDKSRFVVKLELQRNPIMVIKEIKMPKEGNRFRVKVLLYAKKTRRKACYFLPQFV